MYDGLKSPAPFIVASTTPFSAAQNIQKLKFVTKCDGKNQLLYIDKLLSSAD